MVDSSVERKFVLMLKVGTVFVKLRNLLDLDFVFWKHCYPFGKVVFGSKVCFTVCIVDLSTGERTRLCSTSSSSLADEITNDYINNACLVNQEVFIIAWIDGVDYEFVV